MNTETLLLIGLATICTTIGIDLGARTLETLKTSQKQTPGELHSKLAENLLVLHDKHHHAQNKTTAANQANAEATGAVNALAQALQEHIDQLKKAFTIQ